MNSCTELVYRPEEFSFELRMKVNNNVWFKRKVSGQNPPPMCFRPPRFGFAEACIQFHDIWFLGRNMHVCMYMSGSFQGYELFERWDHGTQMLSNNKQQLQKQYLYFKKFRLLTIWRQRYKDSETRRGLPSTPHGRWDRRGQRWNRRLRWERCPKEEKFPQEALGTCPKARLHLLQSRLFH